MTAGFSSDIYSLGVLFFEVIAFASLFSFPFPFQVCHSVCFVPMVLNTLPYPGLASKSANLFAVCSCSLATNPRESGPMLCPTCDIVFFLLNFSLNIPKKHHSVFYYYIQIQMKGPELGLSHISMKLFLFCVSILLNAFCCLYTY